MRRLKQSGSPPDRAWGLDDGRLCVCEVGGDDDRCDYPFCPCPALAAPIHASGSPTRRTEGRGRPALALTIVFAGEVLAVLVGMLWILIGPAEGVPAPDAGQLAAMAIAGPFVMGTVVLGLAAWRPA